MQFLLTALTAFKNNPKLKIHNWKCGSRSFCVLLCGAILKKTTQLVMNTYSLEYAIYSTSYFLESF